MNALYVFPLMITGWEWVIVALVVILLFGGKKIPELAKGLGKGLREFKNGMKDVEKDIDDIKSDLDSDK